MAFSSECSFSCQTYCDMVCRFVRSHHPHRTVGFDLRKQGSPDLYASALTTSPGSLSREWFWSCHIYYGIKEALHFPFIRKNVRPIQMPLGSFTCHTYCDTGPPLLRSNQKDQWWSLLNATCSLRKRITTYFNILSLMWPDQVWLKLTASRMLSESHFRPFKSIILYLNLIPFKGDCCLFFASIVVLQQHSSFSQAFCLLQRALL
jgi:hypothetical protein